MAQSGFSLKVLARDLTQKAKNFFIYFFSIQQGFLQQIFRSKFK
jgi:hypothetical protein